MTRPTNDAQATKPTRTFLLGALLKSARLYAGHSQVELAAKCSVPQSSVAAWETGRRPIGEATLEKVAHALNVTVETLLYRELSARRRAAKAIEAADPGDG